MSEKRDYMVLHHEAMELCDSAAKAERLGQLDAADRDRCRAFELETAAADACPKDLELTRSVLHRSAAVIGMEIAQRKPLVGERHRSLVRGLVMRGLAGDPPAEIITELLDTLDDTLLHRAAHKLVGAVNRCFEDNTELRRREVADRLTYVLMLLEKS